MYLLMFETCCYCLKLLFDVFDGVSAYSIFDDEGEEGNCGALFSLLDVCINIRFTWNDVRDNKLKMVSD